MNCFDRRSMLRVQLLGAGAALVGRGTTAQGAEENPYANQGAERWVIDDTSAVAETESGKVAGYIRDGIRVFMGMP